MKLDPELLVKRLDLKDDQMFKLGDTIDVKASIGLVVVTFLATQTAALMEAGVTRWPLQQRLLLVAAVFLAIAGALAFVELWPRDYEIEPAERWGDWVKELREYYKDDPYLEEKVEAALVEGQMKRTKERITANSITNEQKAKYLAWSFRFTGAALAVNLAILIARATR